MKDNHQLFLDMAALVSEMSKCVSYNVGCVIVKDGRVISMGYNGSPAGYKNCNEMNWSGYGKNARYGLGPTNGERAAHHEWSSKFEIHAEINAILFAAKNGVAIDGSILYSTLMPCNDCLKALMQSGIKEIIYRDIYDRTELDEEVNKMIKGSNIILRQFPEPSNLSPAKARLKELQDGFKIQDLK